MGVKVVEAKRLRANYDRCDSARADFARSCSRLEAVRFVPMRPSPATAARLISDRLHEPLRPARNDRPPLLWSPRRSSETATQLTIDTARPKADEQWHAERREHGRPVKGQTPQIFDLVWEWIDALSAVLK